MVVMYCLADNRYLLTNSIIDEANKLIASHKEIALIYVRTWLPVDLVSVIPFDRLVVNEQLGFVKLFKVGIVDSCMHIVI